MDQQGSGYVPYLLLMFKLIVTTVDLVLAGWVVYTIKTTTRLHKPHNIFVANLLVSGMIAILCFCLISSAMMIGFQLGVDFINGCNMFSYALIPVHVNNMTFVIIAADKVIAITSPFKHKRIMPSKVITAIITGVWLLALIIAAYGIIFLDSDGVIDVSEYGVCSIEGDSFIEYSLIFVLPITVESILAIALNIYLTIKAYQIRKEIEKETRLSGDSSQSETLTTLKRKQRHLRRNMKPIITLLVVISCNVFIVLFFSALNTIGGLLTNQKFVEYVIIGNMGYLIQFFNPLIYGLYFRQVREPMMKHLKQFLGINKSNRVAPHPT